MFVTNRVEARMHVDRSLLLRDWAVEAVRHELIRAVIAEADKSAWRVRPESVHVRCAGEADDWRMLYVGLCSPRTARFVGGEYDGDTIRVERDDATGMSPDRIVRPYRESRSWGYDLDAVTPTSSPWNPEYERSGIDPIGDVWIYTLIA